MTYKRFKAPFRAVVWSYVVWYGRQLKNAQNDLVAGLAFGLLWLLLPVLAGFLVR